MNVLVDTAVWSLALRRPPSRLSPAEQRHVVELRGLIEDYRAVMLGPVRQELLSGIRDQATFERLRQTLRAFPDEALSVDDFEEAARAANTCRAAGVAGSLVDYLLCSVALRRDATIYTTDQDFSAYALHLPLRLHQPGR